MSKVSGVILVGGLGARMQGGYKPLMLLKGRPLLAWVIAAIKPQVDEIWLSVHARTPELDSFGLPFIVDQSTDRIGPMGGIAAALNQLPLRDKLIVPCDTPFLPSDLLERLCGHALAHAVTASGPEPCCCFIGASATLRSEPASVLGWHRQNGSVAVSFEDSRAFQNFNTPEALACSDR